MANLLTRALSRQAGTRNITTLEDYVQAVSQFSFQGSTYPLSGIQHTMGTERAERIGNSFEGYAQAYFANGVVFACMLVRLQVFSSVRFQFQRFNNGRPSEMFGNADLALLEEPWPGGTTQDLLARMIQDADLAGNSYIIKDTPLPRIGGDGGPQLVRLRPDWTDIVLAARVIEGAVVGFRRVGYLYWEGGRMSGVEPAPFLAEEVAHFAPIPDPLAAYRGMSWLTPVIREIQNDGLMMRHKRKFFENAATPNVIVRMDPSVGLEAFLKFKAHMEAQSTGGIDDAYKTLYVGAAADVTIAGTDFQQMDFKSVQGAGETRIAAAAGVHPVIVGLSEGLQGSALNAGNYGQVRKRFANGTMHPLWQNGSGSLGRIVPPPRGARLWYDHRDVPFLQEDEKDAAEIEMRKSSTIAQYVREGFTPESAIAAVDAQDIRLLVHTGLVSVQLQPPGAKPAAAPLQLTEGDGDDDDDDGE